MSGTDGALGSHLFRRWLMAHLVAITIGGALAGGILRTLGQPYYGRMVSTLEAGFIQGGSLAVSMAIFGAIVGTAQWLVLRRSLRSGWWAPATVVGWALSGILMGFTAGGSVSTIGPAEGPMPPLLTAVVVPPAVVVLLGLAQWQILRREFVGAGWWPLVNVAGLFLGLSVGLIVAKLVPWLTPTQFPSAQALGLVSAIAGPIYGLVTWQFLIELRRREAPSGPEPASSE
jgi:hypothetical protein